MKELDQSAQLADLNQQTAQIAFSELQRFFAAGNVVHVDISLDLVAVASALVADDSSRVAQWRDTGLVAPLADGQALAWIEADARVWAVVVAPFVLVQDEAARSAG